MAVPGSVSVPRLAVITGTARTAGIGNACAKAFVKAGWSVLGVDKSRLERQEADEEFQKRYHHLVVDISSPTEVKFVPKKLQKKFEGQKVHCLINNAGIPNPSLAPGEDIIDRWNQVLTVNLSGAFIMTETLLPFLAPGASIIHMSSTRALQSEPQSEAYAASKAGLLGLTHAQAVSLAGKARVNVVLPGWIDTSGDPPSALKPDDHQWHPAGRVGLPEDVAEMCLFLADDAKAGFITGQQFVVDGGVTRKMVYPE